MDIEGICAASIGLIFLVGVVWGVIFLIRSMMSTPAQLKKRQDVSGLLKLLERHNRERSTATSEFRDAVSALGGIALEANQPQKRSSAAAALTRVFGFFVRDEKIYAEVAQTLIHYDEQYHDDAVRRAAVSSLTPNRVSQKNVRDRLEFNEQVSRMVQIFFPLLPEDERLLFIRSFCERTTLKDFDRARSYLISLDQPVSPALLALINHGNIMVECLVGQTLLLLGLESQQQESVDMALRKLAMLLNQPAVQAKILEFLVSLGRSAQLALRKDIILDGLISVFESDPMIVLAVAPCLTGLGYQPEDEQGQVLLLLASDCTKEILSRGESVNQHLITFAVHPVQTISRRAVEAMSRLGLQALRCTQCGAVVDARQIADWYEYEETQTEEQEYYGRQPRVFREPKCPACNSHFTLFTPCDDRFF